MDNDGRDLVESTAKGLIPLMQTVFLAKDIVGVRAIDTVAARVFVDSTVRHVDSFWLNGYYEIDLDYYGLEGKSLYKHRVTLPLKVELPKWWNTEQNQISKDTLEVIIAHPTLEVLAPYVLEFSGRIIVESKEAMDNSQGDASPQYAPVLATEQITAVPAVTVRIDEEEISKGYPLPEKSQIQLELKNEIYLNDPGALRQDRVTLNSQTEFSIEKIEKYRDLGAIGVMEPIDAIQENFGYIEIPVVAPVQESFDAVPDLKARNVAAKEASLARVDIANLKEKALAKLRKDSDDGNLAVFMGKTSAVESTHPVVAEVEEPARILVQQEPVLADAAQPVAEPVMLEYGILMEEVDQPIMAPRQESVEPMVAWVAEPVEELAEPTTIDLEPAEQAQETQQVSAEPVPAEPVSAEPVSAEPVSAEPVLSEPVLSEEDQLLAGAVQAKITMRTEKPLSKQNLFNAQNAAKYRLRYYLVQNGEDLTTIAEKHQISMELLLSANKSAHNHLEVGTVLAIPCC